MSTNPLDDLIAAQQQHLVDQVMINDRIAREFGLSLAELQLLHLLVLRPEVRTGRDLARVTGLSTSTIADMVDRLHRLGFDDRTRSDPDRRKVNITPAASTATIKQRYARSEMVRDLEQALGGFTEGIKGSGITIVAQETYEPTDPTVAPQVKKLAASGADVFLDITTPKAGAQAIATVAQTGWKPLHILNSVASSKAQVLKPVGFQYAQGILTASYFKATDDPKWADDAAMKTFLADLAKHAPDADPEDPYSVYGWLVGETMVSALQKAGEPTRAKVLEAATNLDLSPELLLPGITIKTAGEGDPYPIEAMQMSRFSGEAFTLVGDVIQVES